jgi:F420-dependent oxidoreductase-like protein
VLTTCDTYRILRPDHAHCLFARTLPSTAGMLRRLLAPRGHPCDRDSGSVTVGGVKISTQLMYAGNPRDAADQVVALEQAGLDTIWVPEAYGFDSPTLMGYLAAKTETVEIGSAILNVYSRTPSALLQTAAGLDNVSQGRAIIGLGASGPQVIEGFHGVPYDKPIGRTKEIIELIRRGLRRETLVHEGIFTLPLPAGQGTGLGKPLKLLTKPERSSIPLYIAALGPKSVEGAAEYADGWLPFLFVPEKSGQVWGDALARGAEKRQEGLAPLEICAGGMVAIGEGPETKALLEFARPMVALYVGGMGARGKNFYNDLMCQYGYEQEAKEIQDLYLGGNKRDAEALVPTDLLELGNLVGPASYVKERIAAFAEAGVTNLQVMPASDDPAGTVRQLKEMVA